MAGSAPAWPQAVGTVELSELFCRLSVYRDASADHWGGSCPLSPLKRMSSAVSAVSVDQPAGSWPVRLAPTNATDCSVPTNWSALGSVPSSPGM